MMPRIVIQGQFDDRCGHNFPPMKCPYERCGYREALERLRDAEARERILQEQNDAFDAIGAELSERIRVLESEVKRQKKIDETLRAHLDHLYSLGSKTKLIY